MTTQISFGPQKSPIQKPDQDPEKRKQDLIAEITMQALQKKPDYSPIKDKYIKENPINPYVKPTGVESVPNEASTGYQKDGILGGIGGAIKGIVDYINTPEGAKVLQYVAPDNGIGKFLGYRADQLQSDDDAKKKKYQDDVANRQANLDNIFKSVVDQIGTRDNTVLQSALSLNNANQGAALDNKYAIEREKERQAFEAAERKKAQDFQLYLKGLEIGAKKGDKADAARLKFNEDIQKDATYKNLANQETELAKIKSFVNNPSALDLKVLPVMLRKAAGDSGNIAVAEQKGMTSYGTLGERAASAIENWKSGQLTQQQKDVLQQFISNQETVLNERKGQVLGQHTKAAAQIYGVPEDTFEPISNVYLSGPSQKLGGDKSQSKNAPTKQGTKIVSRVLDPKTGKFH